MKQEQQQGLRLPRHRVGDKLGVEAAVQAQQPRAAPRSAGAASGPPWSWPLLLSMSLTARVLVARREIRVTSCSRDSWQGERKGMRQTRLLAGQELQALPSQQAAEARMVRGKQVLRAVVHQLLCQHQ